ncbi:hypothetical protein [Branchiibius cervicis]|uniref:Uncharacterized protein n=1 Tax=Branchiibius cervicis TaxID=908252 RepID=A0ABW2AWL6_9MICO
MGDDNEDRDLAADLIAAAGAGEDEVGRLLLARLPWMKHLTEHERVQMRDELVASARAGVEAENLDLFLLDVSAWESTAAAKATGDTPNENLTPLAQPIVVTRPDPGTDSEAQRSFDTAPDVVAALHAAMTDIRPGRAYAPRGFDPDSTND